MTTTDAISLKLGLKNTVISLELNKVNGKWVTHPFLILSVTLAQIL